jgi:uncharacterized Ntn-hydrolase superfamily protein
MRVVAGVIGILLCSAASGVGRAELSAGSSVRPVSTYSIVARDSVTGELGVAVQSHWFSVGSVVPWARAGVGAVATQSLVDVSYGPLGLELMGAGRSAESALRGLLQADSSPGIRQVAMVDASGEVAVHTGDDCIAQAGHRTGEGFSVQANLMDRSTVPDRMAEAFEAAEGDLAERMLAALEAAEREGGDIRGRQSAALLVVRGQATTPSAPWRDVLIDLHVEDHPQPLIELRRLLDLHRGYELMNAGDLAVERGDEAAAESAYGQAQEILGDNLEASYWYAVALANAGELERAIGVFRQVFARGDNWRRLTPRLIDAGLLQIDDAELARILGP